MSNDNAHKSRNKELEEHIKNTPNAGPHKGKPRSAERMEERRKLDEIQQAINNGESIDDIYYED